MHPDGEPLLLRARQWFQERGRTPFLFQEQAWQAFWRGESGLINATTGSGKTLAAWIGPLLEPDPDPALAGIRVLWITPLRALARDLEKELQATLPSLRPKWRVEQRTGDTPASRRARQKARPPAALITTPESLSVMLSHADAHSLFHTVQAVIADEWHEFLGSKRGVQLELAIAHLRAIAPRLRVWGMSATLPDLPDAMRTLLGPDRAGTLIRATEPKRYEIESIRPASMQRFPWAGHLGLQLLPQVLQRLTEARTSLLFTNTRSQAELWYHAIVSHRREWLTEVAIHHGSIDARIRRGVEAGLKSGTLRCVVCTSSLDLGVDFPPVDQVLQIGSAKGVARLLQRAGRSGHRPGETSRVTMVPTHAWELLECAAARRAAAIPALEARHGQTLALDVLAQHLVTLSAAEGFVGEAMLREVRGTHAFQHLDDLQWQWVLDFITQGGSALQAYPEFRRVQREGEYFRIASDGLARRHRRAIGTITSDASVTLRWLKGGTLGNVEESFIARMKPGDHFIFAGRALQYVRLRDSVVYVRLKPSRNRLVPRWQGSRMPLSGELGAALLALLEDWQQGVAHEPELESLAPLLLLQSQWSFLPTRSQLLVEHQPHRHGKSLFVFPFAGRLLNEGIATLMAARAARASPRTITITTNEYGFELGSDLPWPTSEATLREWASPGNLLQELLAGINASELARRQFRDIARIAGLVDPGMPRRSKSARQLQVSSGLMFDVLTRHDPGNLLLDQARREVLVSQLDFTAFERHLQRMASQRWAIATPPQLTPFSFPIWADRLQTQTVSTESWHTRVEREMHRLEKRAA